jgi:hypothetical protein
MHRSLSKHLKGMAARVALSEIDSKALLMAASVLDSAFIMAVDCDIYNKDFGQLLEESERKTGGG